MLYFDLFPLYLNVLIVYFNVFQCISNVFIVCLWCIFTKYFNEFIVHLNVVKFISMYFNVFSNVVIGILPSHSHYNNFAMRIYLHICFSLSTMTSFLTCSSTTFFSLVPIDLF
jgi:hypothetical protein